MLFRSPFFIVVDGIDYTGKSSIVARIKKKLTNFKFYSDPSKEFKSTSMLRSLIVTGALQSEYSTFAALLAARAELNVAIEADLAADKNVLCDRYTPSTFAYQIRTMFRDETPENLHILYEIAFSRMFTIPHGLTIILSVDRSKFIERMNAREEVDAFDEYCLSNFDRLTRAYEAYALGQQQLGNKILCINTSNLTLEDLEELILDNIGKLLFNTDGKEWYTL